MSVKSWQFAAVVTSLLVAACSPDSGGRGRASTEAVVAADLVALEASDHGSMLTLTSPRVGARTDVDGVIRTSGGLRVTNVTVSCVDEFGGAYIVATVNGTKTGDGSKVELTIPMGRDDSRYYLALGEAEPSGNEADPASPSATAP